MVNCVIRRSSRCDEKFHPISLMIPSIIFVNLPPSKVLVNAYDVSSLTHIHSHKYIFTYIPLVFISIAAFSGNRHMCDTSYE